jgi:hypothetical protein
MNEGRMKTPSWQRMLNARMVNGAHAAFRRPVLRAFPAISGGFQRFQHPVKYNRNSRINHRKPPGATILAAIIPPISRHYQIRKNH